MARTVIALLGKPVITEDGLASEAITPGYLVMGQATIGKQTGTGWESARVALERDELGNDIDTDYASGDTVKVGAFHAGQRFYGFIASGQNISEDAMLESAGDGTLAAGTTNPMVRAVEAVDASGYVVSDVRIRVEVI